MVGDTKEEKGMCLPSRLIYVTWVDKTKAPVTQSRIIAKTYDKYCTEVFSSKYNMSQKRNWLDFNSQYKLCQGYHV